VELAWEKRYITKGRSCLIVLSIHNIFLLFSSGFPWLKQQTTAPYLCSS